MNRRGFLQTSAASLAVSAVGSRVMGAVAAKPKRVGLIGSGWYGKIDLMRLIQVAPVRGRLAVRRGQADAGRGGRDRRPPAGVEEEAAHVSRLPRDAQGEGPGHRPGGHARPLACAADDRRRRGRGRCLLPEADQRRCHRRAGDARRRAQARPRGAGGHPAPQHAAPGRGPRPDPPRGEARQDRPGRDLLLLSHAQ